MRDSKRMIESRPDQPSEIRRLEAANSLRMGEVRLLLALAMVLVVMFDARAQSIGLIVALLLLAHVLYGAALMLLARRRMPTGILKHAHWADAAWYLVVISLTGGYESKLFLALLLPILVVSLRSGFQRGVAFAALWSLSFAAVGALAGKPQAAKYIEATELWPVATLLLLGILVARWGSAEYTLLRRLAFLNDLKRLATPRYGIAHALSQLAALLCAYLRAERCIVLLKDMESDGYLTSEAILPTERAPRRGGRIGREAVEPLVRVPIGAAMIYTRGRQWRRTIARAYDHETLKALCIAPSEFAELANLLETDSFISLPLYRRDQPVGRLYASSSRHSYASTELEFLRQASGHVSLVIDTIQLVDLLANDKATQERRRISRDLHDGTIQPYIGLKLGLEALRRRMPAADPLLEDVVDLVRMADEGIAELRRYVNGLRDGRAKRNTESLLVAIRRLADKFNEFYGIKVQLIADTDCNLSEAMCDEVLNIVREGLANIQRHTAAASATICLREGDGRLVVEFLNDAATQSKSVPLFFPRSLNERATELGGRVNVENRDSGQTRVAVEIPV